jgi:predicted permease
MQTATILTATATVVTVILCGYACQRRGILSEQVEKSLFVLVIRLLLPCLIFSKVASNPALRDAANLILPPLVGFASCDRICGLRNRDCRGSFAVMTGIQNYGFVPIPLIAALYPADVADATLGVLFLHNVGIELAIWTIAVSILGGGFAMRRMLNPPSIAIVLALGCNLSGLHAALPSFLYAACEMLAGAAIPLALLLVGATIAHEIANSAELRHPRMLRTVTAGAVLRLGLFPLMLLAVASLVVSPELRRVLLVQAAMPAAMFPIILAKHYGGDVPTALTVGLGTSLLALVTMPIWLQVGALWLM